MDTHNNARTNFRSRAWIVERVQQRGHVVAEVAEDMGISQRTVYKWLARYRLEGLEGLKDRSCRPHKSPRETPQKQAQQVLRLRQRRMVAAEIAVWLEMARSTVARILKRNGVGQLKWLDPVEPSCRYERSEPGELLHLDIKKLGRIIKPGHRITGNRRDTTRGAGWEFVHVCIDDHSRLSYVEVLSDEKKATATGFLQRAIDVFASLGITTRAVLTDNGACYRSSPFRDLCQRHGIRHIRTRPYRPQTNGKAERLIQTLLREWAYRFEYRCSQHRTAWLQRYLHFYNCHRMHQSLGGLPPVSRLPDLNNLLGMHS